MSSPDEKYEKKKGPVRKFWDNAKAIIQFLKNRRAARAVASQLASNKAAVIALTTSVAAAGVAGYGVHEAVVAQDQVRTLGQRVAAVENEVRFANVALAQLEHELAELADSSAQGMKNLKKRSDNLADRMKDVRRQVEDLPPAPQSSPVADDALRLAQNAQKAAQKAQKAAEHAHDASEDAEARKAAKEAQKAAQDAHKEALDAQDAAEDAHDRIDALPTPVPGYQPYPRVVSLPDVTVATVALPLTRNFTVDLAKGAYNVTLDTDVSTQYSWTIKVQGGGKVDSAGGAGDHGQAGYQLNANGGTVTFSVTLDGLGPNGTITFSNTTVTFEELS